MQPPGEHRQGCMPVNAKISIYKKTDTVSLSFLCHTDTGSLTETHSEAACDGSRWPFAEVFLSHALLGLPLWCTVIRCWTFPQTASLFLASSQNSSSIFVFGVGRLDKWYLKPWDQQGMYQWGYQMYYSPPSCIWDSDRLWELNCFICIAWQERTDSCVN